MKTIKVKANNQELSINQETFSAAINLHSDTIDVEFTQVPTILRYMTAKVMTDFLRNRSYDSVFGFVPVSEEELKLINELDKRYVYRTLTSEEMPYPIVINLKDWEDDYSDWNKIFCNIDLSDIPVMEYNRDFFIVYIDEEELCAVPAIQCSKFFAKLNVRGIVKEALITDKVSYDDKEFTIRFELVKSLNSLDKFTYLPIMSLEDAIKWCSECVFHDDDEEDNEE